MGKSRSVDNDLHGWIEANMDNCGQFLGGTNLDAHINESKKSRKKQKHK